MELWSDLIDPATLTGYTRAAMEDYERSKGSLAVFLPNRQVPDISVRFVSGANGLVDEARYRSYDAEPEVVRGPSGKRVTLDLPALSSEIPVSEYTQLRTRNAPQEQVLESIQQTAVRVAQGIADRVERMRGTVLATGKATIAQDNFQDEADFQRDPALTSAVPVSWTDPAADRITDLQNVVDVYAAMNGDEPGTMVMSRRAFRALASGNQFGIQLVGGGTRPATQSDVLSIVSAAGLPDIQVYDRRTAGGRVLPDDQILFLPPAGPTDSQTGSPLGSTFWGQTLTATDTSYGIAPVEQPGVVAGVYRNKKPPMIAEVIGDSISLPVLANANLSAALNVFPA